MKNSMNSFIVACVATITLGVHTTTVKAITESFIQNEYGLPVHDIQNNLAIGNNVVKQDIFIGEILQPRSLSIQLVKPVIHVAVKAIEILADQSKPTAENANLTAEEEEKIQPIEPKVEAPVEELETPAISISDKEKDLFARLVEAEAKGESYKGKLAVATVVLNRVESPQFPDTVKEVINEVVGDAYAFSPVQNGEITKPASEESTQAVEEALKREDTLHDSIFFYNPEIATDNWIRSRPIVETIGNHVFAK
ncbi:cell wall hydrolase [Lederbergia wuyishanensis]|uniref:N-acetylmuramoyl-L-alanine amidase n=1 Tax=Lederbergia wuyishanensis TaxID=1347903 RepID=A0ABU0D065_9BACI|nr:cell wall hydrolase [Lederbergia wuyishanensis]MCJ8006415.1 cell wall hydrolase [Lederbergia wuyishanensis]MDQ0341788.1 N-acetylmuramoyl-L-alanine amidase [Lederbergia wuyishanensis]